MASRQYLDNVVIPSRIGCNLDVRFIQLSATAIIPRPFIISSHAADIPPVARWCIRSPPVNVIVHHDVEFARHRRQIELEDFGMPTEFKTKVLGCVVCACSQLYFGSGVQKPIHPRLYVIYLNHFSIILTAAPATLSVNSSTAASKAGVYISCRGLL